MAAENKADQSRLVSGVPHTGNLSLVADGVSVSYYARRQSRSFRNVVSYSSRIEKQAVSNVSLVANEGDCIGVIGQNGSGKSSLLRALCGLEPLKEGRVLAKERPQFLGVSPALVGNRTGYENIRLGVQALGVKRSEMQPVVDRAAEFADIGAAIDEPISTYSSGMAARLRFAISVSVPGREILMVDEALGTGDAAFQERSRHAIENILSGAGTVFLVSHAASTIERFCNRAIWVHDGELIQDSDAESVAKSYRYWTKNRLSNRFDLADNIIRLNRKSYVKPELTII